jgi:6-pyruvoyltetrahydropterin/6-carboxytetrahydropterin synthase
MIYLTRRERFSAAHRLFNKSWSDEKNFETYGACSNPNWHGHNYILWVTIKGEINQEIGYVCDLKLLGKIIRENVIQKLDHKNINLEVDFMKDKKVSTENLAIGIWEQIEPHIKLLGVKLHSVKIEETENNFVEYYGN